MAKSDGQAEAERITAGAVSEANYTEVSSTVARSLSKAMEIEQCIGKYRLALIRARNAFEDEMKAVEQNYQAP